MKILIIDDEESIRRVLRLLIEPKGFVVSEAETGRAGIAKVQSLKPNLIILDLGLPDINGREVLREIRLWSKTPIIILTVTDDEETRVSLLEAGADDFISKPFSSAELLARINVALRHHRADAETTAVFQSEGLFIDLPNRMIRVRDQVVRFTATEFQLLASLVKGAGQVVGQEELLREVWGPNALDNPHYLRIYIGQIRKKLEADPSSPKHVLTEPGVGYRLI